MTIINYDLFNKYINCKHAWIEVYYGVRCTLCGLFFPDDCAPWLAEDDYHISQYMEEAYPEEEADIENDCS